MLRVAFVALAGYVAALLTFLIHEALGHGATAVFFGGQFFDFYVNPLAGSANTVATPRAELVVSAGGTCVTLAVGLLLWWWLRRRLSGQGSILASVFLWVLACEALLDSLGYMTVEPLLGALTGLESGDWLYISRSMDFSPWLLFIAGVLVMIPVAAHLSSDAQILVLRLGGMRMRSRLHAYWALLLPGTALLLLYIVSFHRWMDQPLLLALGSVLGVPLVGVLGLLWPDRAARPEELWAPSATPPRRTLLGWCMGLAAIGIGVATAFGPTMQLRRGLALGPPDPDQYAAVAQEIRIDVDVRAPEAPKVKFRSYPRLGEGSPFRRALTEALAARGPSPAGAEHLGGFVAKWNLDGRGLARTTPPRRIPDGWLWEGELEAWPDSAMIRLWPLTWVKEAWISSVRFHGPHLETNLRGAPAFSDTILWRGPVVAGHVDSFYVKSRVPTG